jgi:hypothetical protein
MIDLKVITMPDDAWLTRLRRGNFVWDVKDEQYAQVEYGYEPPEPGCVSGRIAIRPIWSNGIEWGVRGMAIWFIKQDGTGFDGSQLLLPLEDNCPDDPLPGVHQRSVDRKLNSLTMQVAYLNKQLRLSRELFGMLGEAIEELGERQQEIAQAVGILLDIT